MLAFGNDVRVLNKKREAKPPFFKIIVVIKFQSMN